jgi:conjugal transfer/type IV secretion protein DotA/TraY
MIQSSVCQARTIKAVRNKNFNVYDDYFFSSLPFNDQIKRVANCIAPEVYFKFGDNPIKQANVTYLNFGKKESCNTTAGLGSEYNVEYHGYSFSCGSISFSHPVLDNEINTSTGDSANTGIFDSLEGNVESFVSSAFGDYGMSSKLASYYQSADSVSSGSNFDFKTLQGDIDAYAAALLPSSKNLYQTVKDESDHNTGVKALYVGYAVLYNNLLGAKSENGENGSNVAGNGMMFGVAGLGYEAVKEIRKQMNDKFAMKSGDSIADMEKYSSQAASALDSMHCLQNFRKVYQSTKKTINNLSEGSGAFDKYLKEHPEFYGECLWFTSDSEQRVNERYTSSNNGIDVGGVSVKVTMGAASNLVSTFDPQNPAALAAVQESESLKLALEAQKNKIALAAHFYVVRAALEKAFLETLKDVSDKEVPQKMRKQGWAGFGGYILQISSNQTNATRYLSRINSGVTWNSFSEPNSTGMFVNNEAFSSTVNTNTLAPNIPFNVMVLNSYFSSGSDTSAIIAGTMSGGKSSMTDSDAEDTSALFAGLEDMLTRPMKYLKKMGGLDQSVPLREGVEKCFKQGNCFAGEIHPVNALAYMGSDLLSVAVDYYIAKSVFNGLAWLADTLESGGSASDGNGIMGKIKQLGGKLLSKVGALAIGAIKIINWTLNALAPLFFLLLMLGLFFGYIVPMMPYIAFLILFLGWIILIFQLFIAVPIWLVMLTIPGPTGESRGNLGLLWQYCGQLILRPSLMVIGMIFGWFLSSISIYFINLTFFGVMGPVMENTGTVMAIIDVIMFYMAYLVIVFVALKHSFSVITSFPDAVSKAIELREIGDQGTHSQLGTDNLLKAVIMGKLFQAFGQVGAEAKRAATSGNMSEREKQQQLRDIQDEVARKTQAGPSSPSAPPNPQTGEGTGDALTDAINTTLDIGKDIKGGFSDDVKRPGDK